ncbi:MAG: protein kinase [Blastocatellia bacterium]|nr:protein kinase [Blastocatellia bacterium]MBN8723944.1 protein kinase [Acidobacteriota bacterium]
MKECPTCRTCYEDELLCCPKDSQDLSNSLPWPLVIDNKYRLNSLISRGGMSAVYHATQIELARSVAIKILLPTMMVDQSAPKRLRREALASSRIDHPNVVTVYDYGTLPCNAGYLVMKLLKGNSLSRELRLQKVFSFERILNITFQICSAIELAHQLGVVHCDLKPENIILEDSDFVQILDFGIAKLSEQLVGITLSGIILGTPLYMSPEQFESREVDFRTDIYSIGIMLYEMLTGQVPFNGGTPSAIARQHLLKPVPSLKELRSDITPKLEKCVLTSLAKSCEMRQQSASQLIDELKDAAQELAFLGKLDLDTLPQISRKTQKFKLRTFVDENILETPTLWQKTNPPINVTESFSQKKTEEGIALNTEQWQDRLLETSENTSLHDHTVLIVDDELGILLLLQEIVENMGCHTMTAKDGRIALNLIKQTRPDLIISDIMMPDIDGYKLYDILQADPELSKIPLIFLTARTQRQDKLQALAKGVEDYWTKPFDVTEVELRLKHILKRISRIKLLENK